jgi:hypothetical protein
MEPSICPLKTRIFIWLALANLANKILIWDNVRKRNWIGPRWCVLCKSASESVDHIFVSCSFTQAVWKEVSQAINVKSCWDKNSLVDIFESWISDRFVSVHRVVPCDVLWGVQLTRNKMIFQGKEATLVWVSNENLL